MPDDSPDTDSHQQDTDNNYGEGSPSKFKNQGETKIPTSSAKSKDQKSLHPVIEENEHNDAFQRLLQNSNRKSAHTRGSSDAVVMGFGRHLEPPNQTMFGHDPWATGTIKGLTRKRSQSEFQPTAVPWTNPVQGGVTSTEPPVPQLPIGSNRQSVPQQQSEVKNFNDRVSPSKSGTSSPTKGLPPDLQSILQSDAPSHQAPSVQQSQAEPQVENRANANRWRTNTIGQFKPAAFGSAFQNSYQNNTGFPYSQQFPFNGLGQQYGSTTSSGAYGTSHLANTYGTPSYGAAFPGSMYNPGFAMPSYQQFPPAGGYGGSAYNNYNTYQYPSLGNQFAAMSVNSDRPTSTDSNDSFMTQGGPAPAVQSQYRAWNQQTFASQLPVPVQAPRYVQQLNNQAFMGNLGPDPFYDPRPPQAGPFSNQRGPFQGSGSGFSTPGSQPGRSQQQAYGPLQGDLKKATAKSLAEQIKAGLFDDDSPRAKRRQEPENENLPHLLPHVAAQGAESKPLDLDITAFLAQLQNGYKPTIEEAFSFIPFTELSRGAGPAQTGVIRISNIPYGTTKPEIVAFVGRNARLVSQPKGYPYFAIHIIMERATAKTMDCFVEFETQNEAAHCNKRFQRQIANGRQPRIGDRHVTVELVDHADLMTELFPKAKCVTWQGQQPFIYTPTEAFNSGFQGFLTSEEVVMTVKHAETPQRSPFSHKCLQRTYESMISVLAKYPWWTVNDYTVGERDLLFNATHSLVRALVTAIRRSSGTTVNSPLTPQLLHELVTAGIHAPGFSERQRAKLLDACNSINVPVTLSAFASTWPFEALNKKPDVPDELVQAYANLLKEATTSSGVLSLAEQSARQHTQGSTGPFGRIEIPWPDNKSSLTMAEVAAIEWNYVERLLRKVLPDSSNPMLGFASPAQQLHD